jgi:hypothetical protein
MPDLLVRGIDGTLVKALKERAVAPGRSPEAVGWPSQWAAGVGTAPAA